MNRKRIFLTGAGGVMGSAGLRELLSPGRKLNADIIILDLPTARNRQALKPYMNQPGVEIVWGDLTSYEDVLRCVNGADIILHVAAVIPPLADRDPDLAWRVNVGSAENIVRAIYAQPDPDAVRLVNIGTVAQTGDRLPPVHVGRTGDPVIPSIYDLYGCSKTAAERVIAESGLRYWVSLRQTFIVSSSVARDPIMFHMPIDTCIEVCTVRMAGLVLANICDDNLPDDFWRRFYNIGGGEEARTTYLDFMDRFHTISGIDPVKRVYQRNWFALRNFHCHWFEDSHLLDRYLNHQQEGLAAFYSQLKRSVSFVRRWSAQVVPARFLRDRVFYPLASRLPESPLYWLEHNIQGRISAFFGSRDAYERIPPTWDGVDALLPSMTDYVRLNHGYDERKPASDLDISDIRGAAVFRGGECLSTSMRQGDLHTKLRWRCAFGHIFEATPNLVLKGGHWCPECAPPAWNYGAQARVNPFLAQVWYTNHHPDEDATYPVELMQDIYNAAKA